MEKRNYCCMFVLTCIAMFFFDTLCASESSFLNSLSGNTGKNIDEPTTSSSSIEESQFFNIMDGFYGDPDYLNAIKIINSTTLQQQYEQLIEQIQYNFFIKTTNNDTSESVKFSGSSEASSLSSSSAQTKPKSTSSKNIISKSTASSSSSSDSSEASFLSSLGG